MGDKRLIKFQFVIAHLTKTQIFINLFVSPVSSPRTSPSPNNGVIFLGEMDPK